MTKLLHLFSNFVRNFAGIRRMIHARVHAKTPTIVEISKSIIFTSEFFVRAREIWKTPAPRSFLSALRAGRPAAGILSFFSENPVRDRWTGSTIPGIFRAGAAPESRQEKTCNIIELAYVSLHKPPILML